MPHRPHPARIPVVPLSRAHKLPRKPPLRRHPQANNPEKPRSSREMRSLRQAQALHSHPETAVHLYARTWITRRRLPFPRLQDGSGNPLAKHPRRRRSKK